jgi:hypothetical protein
VDRNDSAVRWLLESEEPSVRQMTLTDVLGQAIDSPEVKKAQDQIPNGPRVRALLKGQRADGGFSSQIDRSVGIQWKKSAYYTI